MISEKFWKWPDEYEREASPLERCARELAAALDQGALGPFLTGPSGNVAEFMALQGREWGVNPWWCIISAQREQSAIEQKTIPLSGINAVMGYVGRDKGRVALPGYYGIYPQIYRTLSQVSWYLNLRPDGRIGKTTRRYMQGAVLKVHTNKDPASPEIDYPCKTVSEFIVFSYTPHLTAMPENEALILKYCPRFL